MDALKIGTYQLGWRWVDVLADPKERGGCYYFLPDDEFSRTRIRVGFDYDNIEECFCVLVHEAMEMMMCEMSGKFKSTNVYINASDTCFFVFDHNKFSDIAARVGHFLWAIRKDFEAAYELIKEQNK